MKAISGLAIGCAIVTSALARPVLAQQQQQIPAPILFSIRSGEALQLNFSSAVTANCTSLWEHFDGIDILDGPKEISLDFKPGKGAVHLKESGKVCDEVRGGSVMITAKDITEPKEANLTFRVRFHEKSGIPWQHVHRYRLLLFPAAEPAKRSEAAPSNPATTSLVWAAVKTFDNEIKCLEFAQEREDKGEPSVDCFFYEKGITTAVPRKLPKLTLRNQRRVHHRAHARAISRVAYRPSKQQSSWGFCRGSMHYTDKGYSCK